MKKRERIDLDSKRSEILQSNQELFTKLPMVKPYNAIYFPWKRPCPQKILIVTDGYTNSLTGSFSHSYFGLSHLVDTLLDQTEYFVDFRLTLAHRQIDQYKPSPGSPADPADPNHALYARYAPNFESFRFTTTANDVKTNRQFDINYYDQIWLVGVRNDDSQRLDNAELALLTDWMDKGGGVFAVGDHQELGAGLCARVPRVSKMRIWEDGYVDNNGNLKNTPRPTGETRHDTLEKGHDAFYHFDDESDDIPMTILPKWYYSWSYSPFFRNKYPHPILCGKDGVIDILPDHPHEGEVIDSHLVKIDETLVNGKPEFPQRGGIDFRPDVIARAQVQPDHTNASDLNKREADAKTFGAIGAYDGYKTDVGRVVVDSTWHHWMDVNLIGRDPDFLDSDRGNAANPKTQGFLATANGRDSLKRIENYFINVGLWLAPKTDRFCMLNGLLWFYTIKYPSVERISPKLPILELGLMAKDALGRTAGQCNLRDWIFEVFPHKLERMFEDFDGKKLEHNLMLPTRELVEIYAFGGALQQLLGLAYEIQDAPHDDKKTMAMVEDKVPELVAKGFVNGFDTLLADMKENMGHLNESFEIFDTVNLEKTLKYRRSDD